MPSTRRCHTHAYLPRIWLGFGELECRKPDLEAIKDAHFEKYKPDYKIRAQKGRWHDLHLDVARKSTKWFDWCVKNGDHQQLVLPPLVSRSQIPSLLHFIYTGDYSVDVEDMSMYHVENSPDDCCTCEQICQLLRVHLAMFQTGLQLGLVELQGLAFGRFRALLDTAPAFVLKYAVSAAYSRRPIEDGLSDFRVHCIKGLMDYRPELVLPAVLRWCGYFRMNPKPSPGKFNEWHGEQEFEEQRQKFPTFSKHFEYALILDTVNLPVPSMKFPGRSEPVMSIHRYGFPPHDPHPSTMLRDPQRSNYQYVTYLQPLPFQHFSDQRPTNLGAPWRTFPGYDSAQSISSGSMDAPINPVTSDSQNFSPTFDQTLQSITEKVDLVTSESALLGSSPNEFAEQPQHVRSLDHLDTMDAPADLPQEDLISTTFPELDLDAILQDAADIDWSQTTNPQEFMTDMDFTSFLSDVDMNNNTWNSADLQLPPATGFEMPTQKNFDFAFAGLPEIDFSGLDPQTSIQAPQVTPMGYTDINFTNCQPAVWVPEMTPQSSSVQSITDWIKPFDWSQAAHSAGSFETYDSQSTEASQPAPRYSLRSRESSASSVTLTEAPQKNSKKRSMPCAPSAPVQKKHCNWSRVSSPAEAASEPTESRKSSRYSLRSREPSASVPTSMGPPPRPSRSDRRSESKK